MTARIDQNSFNLDALPSGTSTRFYVIALISLFTVFYIGFISKGLVNYCLTIFGLDGQIFLSSLFMPVLLVCTSSVIFILMPRIIIHRGHLTSVKSPQFSEFLARIEILANRMQVPCPEVYLYPNIFRQNAQVFGSEMNPKLRVDKGLLLLYARRPDLFDAIVLHELAHILHGDLFKAYAARAIVWATGIMTLPVVVVRGYDFVHSIVGHSYQWTGLVSFHDEITWFLINVGLFLQNIGVFIPLLCILLIEYAKLIRIREHFADWRAGQHGVKETLVSIFQKSARTHSSIWRCGFLSFHPLPKDRSQLLLNPLQLGCKISLTDALVLGGLLYILVYISIEVMRDIYGDSTSFQNRVEIQSLGQFKVLFEQLISSNFISEGIVFISLFFLFILILSAYSWTQIVIRYCLGGWLIGRSVVMQIIRAFPVIVFSFIGSILGYILSPGILEGLPDTIEPSTTLLVFMFTVPIYFFLTIIYFALLTPIVARWMQGNSRPSGIGFFSVIATHFLINFSFLIPAIGFYGRKLGLEYSFVVVLVILVFYFSALILISFILARIWLHRYRKLGNLSEIPSWMGVKSSVLQTQGILTMKISSVEQFKAEIMYNKEFQEKLRENPVKAAEEIEVGSSRVNEERKFSLVLGGVASAVLLVGLIGISILAASRASTSDIENLQSQVDGLKASVAQASADASNAKSAADSASSQAASAEAAANRAAQYAQDTNSKLDTLFKRSILR